MWKSSLCGWSLGGGSGVVKQREQAARRAERRKEKEAKREARKVEKEKRKRMRRERIEANGEEWDSEVEEEDETEDEESASESEDEMGDDDGEGRGRKGSGLNRFGIAFSEVVEQTGARVRQDSFEHCVVEVKKEDLGAFLEALSMKTVVG